MKVTEPYSAGIIQPDIIIADSLDDVRKNLKRTLELIDYIALFGYLEFPMKLIVAPEFFLQGWHLTEVTPSPRGIAECIESFAIKIPGKETEKIGEKCKKYNCFFVGAAIAIDEHWDDRFFNIGFVINPEGKVILRYFKHNSITNQVCCSMTPHDMWDKWTKIYGDKLENFFPIVDTPIGKIGVCQCYDRTFPEVARAFAIQGCEVFCNPTAWVDPWASHTEDVWDIQSRARAIDNEFYVIAPNVGGTQQTSTNAPRANACGKSMVVDYRGKVLTKADYPGETVIQATIDIPQLRRHRIQNKWYNLIPNIRSELYAKIYEKPFWPINRFNEKPCPNLMEIWNTTDEVVQKLIDEGIFEKP